MLDVRLGYVANCLTLGLTASHTCRVAGATEHRLAELVAENLLELEQILEFNERAGIHVFRIGSSLVPLASHPVNRLKWWRDFGRDLQHLGRLAARSGQRLSMHPSPAGASLSSVRPEVRAAALLELSYSGRVLDLLGQPAEARVIVHVGGAAPERETALSTAHRFLDEIPEQVRVRLALENDDRIWPARDVLPLAREHGIPMVADTLHDRVLPSSPPLAKRGLLAGAASSWTELGLRPKFHLASQRAGARPGAHADRVTLEDFASFLSALDGPADVMLEAKEKDLALFELRQRGTALARRLGVALDAPQTEVEPRVQP